MLEIDVNESVICKFVQTSRFTHQKLKVVAVQQDAFLRQQFMAEVTVYHPEMLVFIDETGADNRNLVRKYGYSDLQRSCNVSSQSAKRMRNEGSRFWPPSFEQ